MNFPVLMAKSSFVGISPLLSIPFSLYKTFFSFYSFGSCSSPLFSRSSLYKKFVMGKISANLEVVTSVYQVPPVPMAAPWVAFTDREEEGITGQYNLCERPYSKTHKNNIPEMSGWFRYFQSPSNQGWLVVYCRLDEEYPISWSLKYGDCFLWNPVSLEKIWLPSLHSWISKYQKDQVYLSHGLLSAPPAADDGCIVFFLLDIFFENHPTEETILYCCLGDKQWRSQTVPQNEHAQSITCFQGKLHALCYRNMHLVIEKQLGSDGQINLCITKFPVAQDGFNMKINRQINILESRDELFAVVVDYLQPRVYENITSFAVFRMNFSLMVWEKVKSLGDHVLFLGETIKASCSAADLGLARGRVYFLADKTVIVYDPEDGTISYDAAFSESTKRCIQAQWVAMPMSIRVNTNEAESNIKTSIKVIDKEGNKKNKGSEIIKPGTWDILDMDILELIASYLHAVDYVHFRAVCKTHRSVISTLRKRTTIESSHTTSLSPWLILHQNNQDCVYKFINPMHNNETYLINLSEYLLDATILCSKSGWLLMSKSCERNLFFFNPFTRDMIRLPELPEHSPDFDGISFSSMPTSSDCTVFAISGNHSFGFTYSISRGDDRWRIKVYINEKLSFKEEYLRFNLSRTNPIFHQGRFYCLHMRGTLGVFDIHSEPSWNILEKLVPGCTSYHQSFLVECEGQLLSVFVTSLKTRPVQIFKLHTSKKTNIPVWVKVRDLGKYMLFVSHTSCVAEIAPVSRMQNKIYFPRLHNERIVFYSLDTCRYQTLFLCGSDQCSSSNFYSTKKHLYCTWIEPNWSGATAAELVW